MLRKLVLVLILGNLLLWAWAHGVLRPFGWAPASVEEPQRLRQQWHPEALQLEAPASTGSAAAALPASASSAAPGASAPGSPASSAAGSRQSPAPASSAPASSLPEARATASRPAAAGATPALCLRVGPFAEHPDAAVGDALRAAGLAAQPQVQDLPAQWMVLMGPYADTTTLQRKVVELHGLSLAAADYALVTGRPRYMPGISLGVFSRREQAEAALQHLQARGVQTAHIVQRNLGLHEAWWVLPALDAEQARRLRELPALRAVHAQLRACGADATASAAATAAPASDAPGAPRSSHPAARSRR